MIRKLIVNENLAWPQIDQSDSKKIIEIIESNLKNYPGIKRDRTLPKRFRLKKSKSEIEIKQNNANEPFVSEIKEDENKKKDRVLKKYFRLGINSVTKSLEREPNNVKIVLVCSSCSPLTVMTRHLQIMCSQLNVPAGCVQNLSSSLAKLFNVKTISAFGICYQKESVVTKEILDVLESLTTKINNLLMPLKNPFDLNRLDAQLIEFKTNLPVHENMDDIKENLIVKVNQESEKEKEENMETFGSDFISFNKSLSNEISFDSKNFIIFNDEYETVEDSIKYEEKIVVSNIMKLNKLAIIDKKFNKSNKKMKSKNKS